jgi:pyruvate,orthophosphate dikinase
MESAGAGSGAAARRDAAASPGEAPDEQTELREVVARIPEASELGTLGDLLARLESLLENHFAREEADEQARGALEGDVARGLAGEHRELLGGLADLIRRVREDPSRPVVTVQGEVAALLARLLRHDRREAALLGDGTAEMGGARLGKGTLSQALEVNLRRTAVDVVIPEEQQVLLELTANRYGVQENTRRLLREINHPYVNWERTLDDLHRRAMGDFAHYVHQERAAEAVEVFCGLYHQAATEPGGPSLREAAVRSHLYYLEKVARDSGERLPGILPVLGRDLERLDAILSKAPDQAVAASPRLRRVAQALLAASPEGTDGAVTRSLELLASALTQVYESWLAREDPADWWRERSSSPADAPLPGKVESISHGRLAACRDALGEYSSGRRELRAAAGDLFALPDDTQIARAYLDAASCLEVEDGEPWQSQLERIRWLIRVLSVDALAPVHEQALAEINHSVVDVLRGGDPVALELMVRETFASLRGSGLAASPTTLNLISRIGREALAAGDPEWAELVIGELLEWEFPTPGFSGFTDDWKVQVNPAHLRAIRAHLDVIGANPGLARSLIAGLVVQLKIGGVFIADTDLFQKDVTKLLNSGIGPVYHPVKHLLKLFPVYFQDIGAEGELREVSSRIDEIEGRRDPLAHFLRKQCHVESNPLLIGFTEAIAHFWATGERSQLLPFVPSSLAERLDVGSEEYAGLHQVFQNLVGSGDAAALLRLEPAEYQRRLDAITGARPVDLEKAQLLHRVRRLIGHKYELDHEDLLERLRGFHRIPEEQVEGLQQALAEERDEEALDTLLTILEQLKGSIVSEERSEGIEDIYYKRHIAVGIPSMYGRYREEKFDAVGLTFRIESLANVLFERLVSRQNFEFITRKTLRKVVDWLRLMRRALRVDGCSGRGLATGIAMLDQALTAQGISVDQFVNIFQFLSHSVEQLIRIRFLEVYEPVLERLLKQMLERGVVQPDPGLDEQETILKVSEAFLRDLIAESFGLQQVDSLVGTVLRNLARGRERFDRETQNLLMTYDAERCFVPIEASLGPHDGAILLGNKGYMIKRLAHEGIPVPPGFVLTTDVFRCRKAILACDELKREVLDQVQRQIRRLERLAGGHFGNPKDPLLLSVRSGSTMSMPGVLETFLDVGINEEIAEGFGSRSGSPWGAWDAYRRFIQFWGMGHGVERDGFDALMRDHKQRAGVEKKSQFKPDKMRELALRYRGLVFDHGIEVPEDPFEQVWGCANLVMASWYSEKARIYRKETQIAEEWGTAVVVQCMVYGNLNKGSGTGVALTCDPRNASADVRLHGDFVVQGQGDDVVGGLVQTFPISEEQRVSESTNAAISLEKDFPRVYAEVSRHAHTLIHDQGMFHQEIEFTFESDDPADLYILQTRDAVMSSAAAVPAFVPTEALERSKVATGIGVGGGALSGRVAHTAEDIADLRRRFPDDAIILLRPDTVPDDIPLLLQSDGMVTAIGGATSHAAVVAQRLRRTCVVGCRQLQVCEEEGVSEFEGHAVRSGDFLSINGSDGSVYMGQHPSTVVRRQRLA